MLDDFGFGIVQTLSLFTYNTIIDALDIFLAIIWNWKVGNHVNKCCESKIEDLLSAITL